MGLMRCSPAETPAASPPLREPCACSSSFLLFLYDEKRIAKAPFRFQSANHVINVLLEERWNRALTAQPFHTSTKKTPARRLRIHDSLVPTPHKMPIGGWRKTLRPHIAPAPYPESRLNGPLVNKVPLLKSESTIRSGPGKA